MKLKNSRKKGILITVVDCQGHTPATPGKKALLAEDGTISGTIGGGELEQAALNLAAEMLAANEKHHHLQRYNLSGCPQYETGINLNMVCGGSVTVFFEYIPVAPMVYIFGGGHVGNVLDKLLVLMDFTVVIVDCIPGTHHVNIAEAGSGADHTDLWNEARFQDSYVVLSGFSHEADYCALREIILRRLKPRYIGMVASSTKASTLISRLSREFGPELDLSMLYSPAGLNLGGRRPEDIALTIAAEIQAVRHGKTGHRHMGKHWANN
ncbi:MAG: XdhC family protein [Candidatus Saccharibacteria bacterium]